MATQTYEQLIAGANKIKENELPESNTHDIVGEQLLQMTNKMQEESSNNGKKFSELETLKMPRLNLFKTYNIPEYIPLTQHAIYDFLHDVQVEYKGAAENTKTYLAAVFVNGSQGYTGILFDVRGEDGEKVYGSIAQSTNNGNGIELLQHEDVFLKIKALVNWEIISKETKTYELGTNIELSEQVKHEHKGLIDIYNQLSNSENNVDKKIYELNLLNDCPIISDNTMKSAFVDARFTGYSQYDRVYIKWVAKQFNGSNSIITFDLLNSKDESQKIENVRITTSQYTGLQRLTKYGFDLIINWEKVIGNDIIYLNANLQDFAYSEHIGYLDYYIKNDTLKDKVLNIVSIDTNPLVENVEYKDAFIDAQFPGYGGKYDRVYVKWIAKNLNGRNFITVDYINSTTEEKIENVQLISDKLNGKQLMKSYALTVIIDWDIVTIENKVININSELKSFVYSKHLGSIDQYDKINQIKTSLEEISEPFYDQFFARNGKLLAYSNDRGTTTCAKYYRVDLGSKVKKVSCRFIHQNKGSLMLITLPNDNKNTDISTAANHSGIVANGLNFAVYKNSSNIQTYRVDFTEALVVGNEYEVSYEFIGNDGIRVVKPDKTTEEFTLDGIDEVNGQYFILEYFYSGFNEEDSDDLIDWTPICTGICVDCENSRSYIDNFNYIGPLTVSPTAHVYRCFKNRRVGETIYENTYK